MPGPMPLMRWRSSGAPSGPGRDGGAAPSDGELPYASVPLSRGRVRDAGGAAGAIGDGEFTLDATPGEHLLCLVQDSGEGERARGCSYADLPSSGSIEVTTGEAGFRVEVR